MDPEDPREELRALVAGFRTHLEARGRSGLLGVSAAVAPRAAAIPKDQRPPPNLPHAADGAGEEPALKSADPPGPAPNGADLPARP